MATKARLTTLNAVRAKAKRAEGPARQASARNAANWRKGNVAAIAARIKSVRRRKQVSLDALAAMVGLDKSYLSRIERGLKVPSVATLLNIAAALNIAVGQLFGEASAQDAITVVRRGEHIKLPRDMAAPAYETILSANERRRMSMFMISPLDEAPMEKVGHPGDELIYVLQGSIEVTFTDRTVTLEEGDVIHFGGELKHQIRRVGEHPALALVVVANELSDTQRVSAGAKS